MKTKTYRFFFHWNKPTSKWSVHFRGQCLIVDHIECNVPCISKINKRQPFRVMQGFATDVTIHCQKNESYVTIL